MIENLHTIIGVERSGLRYLNITWSGGKEAQIDFSWIARETAFNALNDSALLGQAEIGEWGHSLIWPNGVEIGADSLWLDSLSVWGRNDTRTFLEWRYRHGLSLSGAAEALGLSRRQIAYYSSGAKSVPKPILLACKGWEAFQAA